MRQAEKVGISFLSGDARQACDKGADGEGQRRLYPCGRRVRQHIHLIISAQSWDDEV